MISDIGPGMRVFIDFLEAAEGDFAHRLDFPNGWGLSVIRTAPHAFELPEHIRDIIDNPPREMKIGGSYGADLGLFEVALTKFGEVCFDGPLLQDPEGYMSPVDVARKAREVFGLPQAAREES